MKLQRLEIEGDKISAQLRGMRLEGIVAQPIGNPIIANSNHYHVYGGNRAITEKEIPMKAFFESLEKLAQDKYPLADSFVANLDHTTEIGREYFVSRFAVQFYRTEGGAK